MQFIFIIMIVAIAANDEQKLALEQKGFKETIDLKWVATSIELYQYRDADAWIDCLFDGTLVNEYDKPLLIHSPIYTLGALGAAGKTARFCAWSGFAGRSLWEIALQNGTDAGWLTDLMDSFGWGFRLVNDGAGLIAPRVISMIINEAHFALAEGVSSKTDIDIAMKLGTNYPFGPFEWAEKIGVQHIYSLLKKLAEKNARYEPSGLLQTGY